MDEDYDILEETALEEMSAAWDDADYDEPESEDYDYDEELAYYERQERQAAYDEEWGDPVEVGSYAW